MIDDANLQNVRNKESGDLLFVSIPIRAIFQRACMVVTQGAVDQENGKIDRVEIRENGRKSGEATPAKRHQPVASIVDFASKTPPARDEKLGTALGGHGFEMGDGSRIA